MWPTQSRKKRTCRVRSGWAATRCGSGRCRGYRTRSSRRPARPAPLSIRNTTEVRSAPVRAGGGPRTTHQDEAGSRVRFVDHPGGEGAQPVALGRQCGAHTGVGPPSATSRAAAALELAGTTSASGRQVGQPVAAPGRPPPERHRAHLVGGHTGTVTMLKSTSRGEFGINLQRRPPARLSMVGNALDRFSIGTRANRRHRRTSSAAWVLTVGPDPVSHPAPFPGGHHQQCRLAEGPRDRDRRCGPRPQPQPSAAGALP